MIFDKLEQQLPAHGIYTANDGTQNYCLNTRDKQLAKNLHNAFEKRIQDIKSLFIAPNQFITIESKKYDVNSLSKAFNNEIIV